MKVEDYNIPEPEKVIIDSEKNEVIDKDNLSPFEKIELAAKINNIEIQEPKKNCKKCYGRGYLSVRVDNQEPIPCTCIFNLTKEEKYKSEAMFEANMQMNRKDRRRFEKRMRKMSRKVLNERKK